jgi:hypothetical protein
MRRYLNDHSFIVDGIAPKSGSTVAPGRQYSGFVLDR